MTGRELYATLALSFLAVLAGFAALADWDGSFRRRRARLRAACRRGWLR